MTDTQAGAHGWQPIETAPREPFDKYGHEEGPTILICGGFMDACRPAVRTGHWKGRRTNAWCDTALGRCPKMPTHWMPLPHPPVAP